MNPDWIEEQITEALQLHVAGKSTWEEFRAECNRIRSEITLDDALDYLNLKGGTSGTT